MTHHFETWVEVQTASARDSSPQAMTQHDDTTTRPNQNDETKWGIDGSHLELGSPRPA